MAYLLSREINDTYDSQAEENFYDSITIAQTVWNWYKRFLRYRIEKNRGVILRFKLATHHEQMSKSLCVSLFSAMFLPNINWISLRLGKLSQKIKGWTFYWDTVYMRHETYPMFLYNTTS